MGRGANRVSEKLVSALIASRLSFPVERELQQAYHEGRRGISDDHTNITSMSAARADTPLNLVGLGILISLFR